MKHFRLPAFALAAVTFLAACGGRDPVADEANAIPALVTNDTAGAAAGGPPAPATNDVAAAGPIPAAIQGRWGLSPADCIATRSDNKGLLEIGPDSLKFYESRAVPGTSIEAGDQEISGNFNFTGEGQLWSKYVSLKLQGKVLTRTERNPVASYNYARC
ncbi:MAG: hypothetical protein ABIS39_05725 [Sphingomicrobium sp.]